GSFSAPGAAYARHLHSPPTRRSSDLYILSAPIPSRMPAEVAEIATPSQAEKRGVQGLRRNVRPATANTSTERPMPAPMYHFQYRSEEHTSELQSQSNLVCRLLLEKKT